MIARPPAPVNPFLPGLRKAMLACVALTLAGAAACLLLQWLCLDTWSAGELLLLDLPLGLLILLLSEIKSGENPRRKLLLASLGLLLMTASGVYALLKLLAWRASLSPTP